MSTHIAIERLVALSLVVTGLSHITAPQAWVAFFEAVRKAGPAAGLFNAYVHFPLGAIVLTLHPIWQGPGLLVTLLGTTWTIKGALYFIYPSLATAGLARVASGRAWQSRVAGLAGVLLGLATAALSWR